MVIESSETLRVCRAVSRWEERGELHGDWECGFSLTLTGLAWSVRVREGARRVGGVSSWGPGQSLGGVPKGLKSSEGWMERLSGNWW